MVSVEFTEVTRFLRQSNKLYGRYIGVVWVYRLLWLATASVTLGVVFSDVGSRWLLLAVPTGFLAAVGMVVAAHMFEKFKVSLNLLPFKYSAPAGFSEGVPAGVVWVCPGFRFVGSDRLFGFVVLTEAGSVRFRSVSGMSLPSSVLSSWIGCSDGTSYNLLSAPTIDFVRHTRRGMVDIVSSRDD